MLPQFEALIPACSIFSKSSCFISCVVYLLIVRRDNNSFKFSSAMIVLLSFVFFLFVAKCKSTNNVPNALPEKNKRGG